MGIFFFVSELLFILSIPEMMRLFHECFLSHIWVSSHVKNMSRIFCNMQTDERFWIFFFICLSKRTCRALLDSPMMLGSWTFIKSKFINTCHIFLVSYIFAQCDNIRELMIDESDSIDVEFFKNFRGYIKKLFMIRKENIQI